MRTSYTVKLRFPDQWRKRAKWLGVVGGVAALLFMPALLREAAEVLPVPPGGVMLRIVVTILIWSLSGDRPEISSRDTVVRCPWGMPRSMAWGAYTSALLVMRLEVPFVVAFFAAGAASALLGLAVGFPAIRIRGLYLFIVTIGFGEITQQAFLNWDAVTNGPLGLPGIPPPMILGYEIVTNTQFYYFALVVVALVVAATYRIVNSDIGRSFQAIREDETAASAMGINTTYYKTLAFVIGAFYAGLAGSIVAHFLSVVGPTQFSIDDVCACLPDGDSRWAREHCRVDSGHGNCDHYQRVVQGPLRVSSVHQRLYPRGADALANSRYHGDGFPTGRRRWRKKARKRPKPHGLRKRRRSRMALTRL